MTSSDKLNQNSNEKNPEKIKALKEVSKAEAWIQAAKN